MVKAAHPLQAADALGPASRTRAKLADHGPVGSRTRLQEAKRKKRKSSPSTVETEKLKGKRARKTSSHAKKQPSETPPPVQCHVTEKALDEQTSWCVLM